VLSPLEESEMKRIALSLGTAACAVVFGVGAASSAGPKVVTVAMHDPGCHWFAVHGKFLKTLSVSGPVSLYNVDEATLKVAGPHGTKLDRVGQKLALARGTYHITMVGQAPDDNHLTLVVR
jgi:hypothetical protein